MRTVVVMNRFLIISVLALFQLGWGQSFGQNKVQYHNFNWSFIKSPHFDIYFYGGQQHLADFTQEVAEEAYEQISKHLRWTLKKRVSILVYNSHNDFQQTNVTYEYMVEGIGGVTELFKNRVVLPFEGSYEQFRHVIHHELIHAMINDMIYGGNVQSIVSGRTRLRIPLWVNEGLAEFLSMNWDTQADMIMRDLAVHDYMPKIQELDYYMAYKGGQSVWRFITGKYGREKVGEIFKAMKSSQSAEKGYERALGMDWDDLTDLWHKYLKREYWPDVADRDELEDIAKRLTDHEKLRNYYNTSPAISPDGSKVAVLSDRSGYANIYLLDAISGKEIRRLVKGNRSIDFEELKWLQPGISWSPDNRKIVIAAKAGSGDVFHLIDVETRKSEKIPIQMDGIFTADWSPDGTQLAFVGNQGGVSDIYIYNLTGKTLVNLTNDIFSDSEPAWSPDGSKIAFVSDRGEWVTPRYDTETGEKIEPDMINHDYSQNDIYVLEVETKQITRITRTGHSENYPKWAHTQNVLFYTADNQGVWNLYIHDLDSDQSRTVTNVLTGIFQLTLSQDDNSLIFSGYSDRGWDLYSLSNPLALGTKDVKATQYINTRDADDESIVDLRMDRRTNVLLQSSGDYSMWIFAPHYEQYNETISDEPFPFAADSADSYLPEKEENPIPQPYRTRFTLDLVSGNLAISNVFGARGMTYFSFSDIMGDHQIAFGTEMVLSLENSDYFVSYAYLKNRTDYYFTGFQIADWFTIGFAQIARLRYYGAMAFLSRPFNRFNRLDYGLSFQVIDYKVLEVDYLTAEPYIVNSDKLSAVIPAISWVYDNSRFGYTGPIDGYRHNVTLQMSPGWGVNSLQFQTLKLDTRKYIRVGRDYTFAGRLMLGKSLGKNSQKFFLGGVSNWLFGRGETNGRKDANQQFREGILDTSKKSMLEDIYFAEYVLPVRGYRYMERFGSNVALLNLEFRYPFIKYLAVGFPLKIILGNIFGHAFLDLGAAWDTVDEFKGFQYMRKKYGYFLPEDFTPFIAGFGVGMKINLGYFLLRIDTAWDINSNGYSRPQYYFSLGPDW